MNIEPEIKGADYLINALQLVEYVFYTQPDLQNRLKNSAIVRGKKIDIEKFRDNLFELLDALETYDAFYNPPPCVFAITWPEIDVKIRETMAMLYDDGKKYEVVLSHEANQDLIVAIYPEDDETCITLTYIKAKKMWGQMPFDAETMWPVES